AIVRRQAQTTSYAFGQTLGRVGISRFAEVRAGLPSYLHARTDGERVSGLDDLFLGTKITVKPGDKAAFAILLSSLLPTGSRNVAEHRFQPAAALASDVMLTQNVLLTLNLGAARASSGGQRFNQVFGASTFNFTISPKLSAYTEVYAFNQPGGSNQKYTDGGLTYLLNA